MSYFPILKSRLFPIGEKLSRNFNPFCHFGGDVISVRRVLIGMRHYDSGWVDVTTTVGGRFVGRGGVQLFNIMDIDYADSSRHIMRFSSVVCLD